MRRACRSDHLGRINTRKWVVRAPNFALFAFCTQRVPTTAPGLAQCQAHAMRLLPAPAAVAVPAQRRAHTRVAPGLMAGKDRRGAAATMARGAAARRPPAASRGSVRATRDPARNILEAVWLIGRITIELCQKILLFWNLYVMSQCWNQQLGIFGRPGNGERGACHMGGMHFSRHASRRRCRS